MSGSNSISGYWKKEIQALVKEISSSNYKKITIEAHADGVEKTPKLLSRLRGKAVCDELILNGVQSDKISYYGFSDVMPVSNNDNEAGRMQNRRAEIIVE